MSSSNFYEKSVAPFSFYSGETGGTEPDMRQELINMFDGKYPEVAKSQPGLLRRMRRDSSDKKIPCGCVDLITKEPDKDRFCPICYSEGFLWDEEELQIYRVLKDSDVDNVLREKLIEPGLINIPLMVFYIRYDSNITENDKIVQLVLDLDGTAVTPRKRKGIYRIGAAADLRSDNGKLEFWKIFAYEEKVKHLNAPAYEDL